MARRYEQRLRAEAAEETRRRILDAVYERLREAPARKVSIDQVARMAGVARSTVYLIFGSRAGLFQALADDLVQRGGYERLVAAIRHEDAREALRGGIRAGAEIFAAHRDVSRALFSMALLDDEAIGGALRTREQERTRGMAYAVRRLDEAGELRPGLSREDAAHILWVLTSFDAFDLLYTGRGLPLEEVVRLLTEAAEGALCR